jgi:hypothetical protein
VGLSKPNVRLKNSENDKGTYHPLKTPTFFPTVTAYHMPDPGSSGCGAEHGGGRQPCARHCAQGKRGGWTGVGGES